MGTDEADVSNYHKTIPWSRSRFLVSCIIILA